MPRFAVAQPRRGGRGRRAARAGTSCSRPRPPPSADGPTWPACIATSTTAEEMAGGLGRPRTAGRRARASARRGPRPRRAEPVVQAMAPRGVALVITQPRGRGLRADHLARAGGHPERAARRHRLPGAAPDHRRRVRDGPRPAGGADAVRSARRGPASTSPAIEDVLHRIAQLADEHPQLASRQPHPVHRLQPVTRRPRRPHPHGPDRRPARPPGPHPLTATHRERDGPFRGLIGQRQRLSTPVAG